MSGTDIYLVASALVGIAIAWERATTEHGGATLPAKFILLGWIVVVAWTQSTTWRGVLYLTLMPIGAYKAMEVLAAPIMVQIAEGRARRARNQSS